MSAELNRWRYENLWSTLELAEMQSSESSHVYDDCDRAVSLVERTLIAEINHIIPDQPPSRYQIEAYIENQTLANYRSTPAQLPPARDNGPIYVRGNNYREKRSGNQTTIIEQGEEGEQNGAQSRMQKDEVPEKDDELFGCPLTICTQIQLIANCHRATIILQQPAVKTNAIQTQVQQKVGARLLNFYPQWRSIDQNYRILKDIALTWRDQDSAHNLEVLNHKTTFKGHQEVHLSLSKINKQQQEDEVITKFLDLFIKCWNTIFAIPNKKGVWRKILDCLILNSELRTEHFKLEGITDIQEIITPNDWVTTIVFHQAFHYIRAAEEMQRCQEAIQLENLRQCRRYSGPEFGSQNIAARNIASNEEPTSVWLDDRNRQELNQHYADNRVLVLAVEHKNNDNINDNIPKQKNIEATKESDGSSQEKEAHKNKRLCIYNWRDQIHKSTNQTWSVLHKVSLKAAGQGSSQQRLEQVDSTQQKRETRRNMVDQQTCPQSTFALQETQQVISNPDKSFVLWMGATLIKENQQKPIGKRLFADNTVTMYYLNKGKGSIIIAPLVDKVIKLAEQYSWTIEANHFPGLSSTISDSLSRLSKCGDYTIMNEVLQMTLKELVILIPIDVIETRANRQCTRYCSISKDKFAVKRNGFKDQEGTGSNSNLDNTALAQSEVKLRAQRDCNSKDMFRREYESPTNLNRAWKQRRGSTTWINLPFFSGSKDGEMLFRQLLQARGLCSNAFKRVISNWSSQWRAHILGLTLLAGYLKKIYLQPENLLNLEQPQIFMVNYLEEAINQKCSDNSVKNRRCALAVLHKFMGYSEQQIHSDLVKQLMRKIRIRLGQTEKEKEIWDLDILLTHIKSRAIAATLVVVLTVARVVELNRATLFSTSDDEYIIQITILQSQQRIVEFKIRKIPDEGICPLRWFKSRFAYREPMIPNKAQELWRISHAEKYIQADDLSTAIGAVMQFAGFSKIYSVTSIRVASITKLIKHNISRVHVDRFTRHSDTASTVRQYYDKNNNIEAREILGQTEEELDNEEDDEQERTLLEEIEYERSNVEQGIPSPVGVLSQGLSKQEIPIEVVDHQKAQQNAANTEEVARLLDSFNTGRVNKQLKSSISLQEVVYNPEKYKQSSGSDMRSSFVPPHQDVPTLGNLGRTESSEVYQTNSADEEHEALMQKEKVTDDQ
ncbi:MAG: hypothetical protein EZS28_007313 [Streblomastix strix]|uniref:Tyr recombinase domain-containing protein n=1 Tax=Streblomastix strix TaxID=222440 RepID=A0A5J4WRE0_9EUKA|nr:MAG: hypothetical protein EZS28_007313 [Streblomastix strix]